nr:hypothetical protein [Tanacetum cinerariifolium]
MALPPRDQRHQYLRFEGLQYTEGDIADYEMRLAKIYMREVHRVQVFDFGGLPNLMAEGLSSRMLIEHRDAQGQSGVRRRMSRREFILALGLHTTEEMQTTGFGLYWVESARQILYKGDLSAYWIVISSAGDFLGTPPSYTLIKDPMLRLCHILISYSIVGRSQAPEKVIVTDLFYLRGMDVESVNVPYLLGRYLRLFASGRKQGAMISGELPVIDMAELPEGAPAIPAPVQASQPPPPIVEPAQTMAQSEGLVKACDVVRDKVIDQQVIHEEKVVYILHARWTKDFRAYRRRDAHSPKTKPDWTETDFGPNARPKWSGSVRSGPVQQGIIARFFGREALTLEDVMATLNLMKIKERSKAKGDNGEGLYVRGKTVRHTSIRVIFALTACKDYELEQLDVKTVFLHDILEEVIDMRQPPRYEQGNKTFLKKEFDMKELDKAKKILGVEIIRDRILYMPLGGHFKLSLKDCPFRDYDVERMSKVSYANEVVAIQLLQVVSEPAGYRQVKVLEFFDCPGPRQGVEDLRELLHKRKHKPRRKEKKETEVSPTEIHTKDRVPTTSNDPLPSGEDRMKLK